MSRAVQDADRRAPKSTIPAPRSPPRTKRPLLAAALGVFLGPFGSLYIGWRYGIMAIVVLMLFTFVLTIAEIPISWWGKYQTFAVIGWKAYTISAVRNKLVEKGTDLVPALNSFRT